MVVDIEEFLDKYSSDEYRSGIYIPSDVSDFLDDLLLKGIDVAEIRDSVIQEIEDNRRKQEEWDAMFNLISKYRVAGIELEKVDIDSAIQQYKRCIEIGETTDMFGLYRYAYERVIILLHRIKDFKGERFFVISLLKHDLDEDVKDKYQKRLIKLNQKLNL